MQPGKTHLRHHRSLGPLAVGGLPLDLQGHHRLRLRPSQDPPRHGDSEPSLPPPQARQVTPPETTYRSGVLSARVFLSRLHRHLDVLISGSLGRAKPRMGKVAERFSSGSDSFKGISPPILNRGLPPMLCWDSTS